MDRARPRGAPKREVHQRLAVQRPRAEGGDRLPCNEVGGGGGHVGEVHRLALGAARRGAGHAQDHRHAVDLVVQVGALAGEAVRAGHVPMVGGEDDRRGVVEVQLPQPLHQPADQVVDQLDVGEVAGERAAQLVVGSPVAGTARLRLQRRQLALVDRLAGEVVEAVGPQGDVGRVVAQPPLLRHQPRAVRAGKGAEQQERPVGVAAAQEVAGVARCDAVRKVVDRHVHGAGVIRLDRAHHRPVVGRRMPLRAAQEGRIGARLRARPLGVLEGAGEQVLGRADVPLAEVGGLAIGLGGGPVLDGAHRRRQVPAVGVLGGRVVEQVVAVRVQAGHQAGAGRRADRHRRVAPVEDHRLGRQRVQVGRAHQRVAVTAQQVAAELVAEHHQHVGRAHGRRS